MNEQFSNRKIVCYACHEQIVKTENETIDIIYLKKVFEGMNIIKYLKIVKEFISSKL